VCTLEDSVTSTAHKVASGAFGGRGSGEWNFRDDWDNDGDDSGGSNTEFTGAGPRDTFEIGVKAELVGGTGGDSYPLAVCTLEDSVTSTTHKVTGGAFASRSGSEGDFRNGCRAIGGGDVSDGTKGSRGNTFPIIFGALKTTTTSGDLYPLAVCTLEDSVASTTHKVTSGAFTGTGAKRRQSGRSAMVMLGHSDSDRSNNGASGAAEKRGIVRDTFPVIGGTEQPLGDAIGVQDINAVVALPSVTTLAFPGGSNNVAFGTKVAYSQSINGDEQSKSTDCV
jgi:hypothetical protein